MDKDNTKKIKIEAFMKRCKKLGFLQEKQSCFWNHMDSLQDINIKMTNSRVSSTSPLSAPTESATSDGVQNTSTTSNVFRTSIPI